MDSWSPDQLLALAPDPASIEAARGLAKASRWAVTGRDSMVAWGETKASGGRRYQIVVDLCEPAFHCPCPSKRSPCKHALGLSLLLAVRPTQADSRPTWVGEWLRCRPAQTKRIEPPKEARPVAYGAEAQLNRILAKHIGLLDEWLAIAKEFGIATPPSSIRPLLDVANYTCERQRSAILEVVGELGKRAVEWDDRLCRLRFYTAGVDRLKHGNIWERKHALAEMRSKDPQACREWLKKFWARQRQQERSEFLKVLSDGLSAEDVPLLERARRDRFEWVRHDAIVLLAALPHSDVAREARRITSSCVRVRKTFLGPRVDIELPEDGPSPFDELEDRLDAPSRSAAKLALALGCVPPSVLRSETGVSHTKLLRLIGRHRFGHLVRKGLLIAADRYEDADLTDAFLDEWAETLPTEQPPLCTTHASEGMIDSVRLRLLKARSPSALWVLLGGKPFRVEVSREIIAIMSDPADNVPPYMPGFAGNIARETIPLAMRSIPQNRDDKIRKWAEVLALRVEIHDTLRKAANK